MRGTVTKYVVRLKKKHRKRLAAIVRRRTPEHWMVIRARIILLSDGEATIQSVCAGLSLDRQVVRRWRKRYLELGFEGLKDRKRTGRPTRVPAQVWQKVVTVVVQEPSKFGIPLARWSTRELSRFMRVRDRLAVSPSSLRRFLQSMALKPHRVKYWMNPTDPDFDAKAAAICDLYVAPPPKTTLLSLDEKPGVQAISRRHPTRPMAPGRVARVEFEYKRNGTRNVFAAFNVRTGHVLVEVTPDRKQPRVIAFLNRILAVYRRGAIIIITDNINTRRSHAARAWLAGHSRVKFVFTPFHGSWLNQVEIWFGILSRKALVGRSFSTVDELDNAVLRFADRWNHEFAKPFSWTYTGKVLAA